MKENIQAEKKLLLAAQLTSRKSELKLPSAAEHYWAMSRSRGEIGQKLSSRDDDDGRVG
jgi:hypothetical protein